MQYQAQVNNDLDEKWISWVSPSDTLPEAAEIIQEAIANDLNPISEFYRGDGFTSTYIYRIVTVQA